MSDLIDRQAALNKIGQINGILLFNGAILINYLDAEKAIEDLPFAQSSFSQRHENDLIRRADAIDAFMTATSDGDKAEWCKWVIENLPSAQPEIIRCKDCKYYRQYDDQDDLCVYTMTSVEADDYCSYAERKEGADR